MSLLPVTWPTHRLQILEFVRTSELPRNDVILREQNMRPLTLATKIECPARIAVALEVFNREDGRFEAALDIGCPLRDEDLKSLIVR